METPTMEKTGGRMKKMRKTMKNRDYECCDATFHGIHTWYKDLFEKLGWMVLANKHGMHDKISVYKHSLQRLKSSIIKKWKSIHDKDKKDDLAIMLENVECLIEHVDKDF